MNRQCERIIGIARHRLSTDGDGVTTLVAFHGCPLHCHYCLNPQSLGDGSRFRGTIRGVEPSGALIVEGADGTTGSYLFKEIEFVLKA